MIDREKVVRAVETCFNSWIDKHRNMGLVLDEVERMKRDALELLKEQETTLEKDGHHIRCLNCGEYWCDNDREGNPFPMNFCPNCGRKVKWND